MIKRNSGNTLSLDEDYKHLVERALIVAALPFGSFAAFGRQLNVTRQAVHYWFITKEVPIDSAMIVSKLSGIEPLLLSPKAHLKVGFRDKEDSVDIWKDAIEESEISGEAKDYLLGIKKFPKLADYKKKQKAK